MEVINWFSEKWKHPERIGRKDCMAGRQQVNILALPLQAEHPTHPTRTALKKPLYPASFFLMPCDQRIWLTVDGDGDPAVRVSSFHTFSQTDRCPTPRAPTLSTLGKAPLFLQEMFAKSGFLMFSSLVLCPQGAVCGLAPWVSGNGPSQEHSGAKQR